MKKEIIEIDLCESCKFKKCYTTGRDEYPPCTGFEYCSKNHWEGSDPHEEAVKRTECVDFEAIRSYYVIESKLNNQPVYWTGNMPHLSIKESEQDLPMWTSNIHEAKKFTSSASAGIERKEFDIYGAIEEHMDI